MLSNCSDKISVIVPAYNIAEYLPRCIESILAQTYADLEVIVVNDGSRDDTDSVVKAYCEKDARVRLISKPNEGVTVARLTGIKAATGQWIGFVDGDDFIEPEMYEVLLGNAKKYNADISHCGYQMVFPSRVDYYYNTGVLEVYKGEKALTALLEGKLIEPGLCNKLYKSSVCKSFLKSQIMDMSVKNNEDLLMNYYLFKEASQGVFLDKCFYHYILRQNSAATAVISENKLKDPLKVLKIIKEDSTEDQELQRIINARIAATLIRLATMSVKQNPRLLKPYKKYARKELRRLMPTIIKGSYGVKLKLLTLWVAICPWLYSGVHFAYSKVSGIDKKYEVR